MRTTNEPAWPCAKKGTDPICAPHPSVPENWTCPFFASVQKAPVVGVGWTAVPVVLCEEIGEALVHIGHAHDLAKLGGLAGNRRASAVKLVGVAPGPRPVPAGADSRYADAVIFGFGAQGAAACPDGRQDDGPRRGLQKANADRSETRVDGEGCCA
jgi:hypothetical protein